MGTGAAAHIAACDCLTPFGDAGATVDALLQGRVALELKPVLGRDGGDAVPLALIGASVGEALRADGRSNVGGALCPDAPASAFTSGRKAPPAVDAELGHKAPRTFDESLPPRWMPSLKALAAKIPAAAVRWGTAREPVVVTSSNFGVGSLYAFTRDRDPRHLRHGPPFASVEMLQAEFGWGPHVHVFSHACVTAHLGLAHAGRLLHAGLADRVLVFSFDFVSPFVAGGFHSLKILNGAMPAPYVRREIGAIGLGDGAAFAVLTRDATEFRIEAHALHNEMHHFTGNQPDGAGFAVCAQEIAARVRGRRVWVKGHGTGTLDAGRLEAEAIARAFPGAPLVSWKGSLGHTLGSCGLVELAIALAAMRGATANVPGTVGSAGPCFTDAVALRPFVAREFEAAVLTSNAFGGAHAALLLSAAGA